MLESTYFQLQFPSADQKKQWISKREGETRIGQELLFRQNDSDWKQSKFHILGICEDIGPQVNGGFSGARNAFPAFIPRFCGMQSNEFLNGKLICIHGLIAPVIENCPVSSEAVQDLDTLISAWAGEIHANGGIPIVIGGGHNNAFGLIKGVAKKNNGPIDVVNLDPHADTRALEGRHSGNPFSYAFEEGLLRNYSVLGLHESYNNQYILDVLKKMKATTAFFESWIDEPKQFNLDIDRIIQQQQHQLTGLELDMDAIIGMPSSAFTPSGVTLEQARYYIRKMSSNLPIAYLHLPEAAPQNDLENKIVGKSLSYLVSDFIKFQSNFLKIILS
ncbi:MAG: arginase family protein [Fluviicola sp.]|nr:arginase family protein [Fluviicola sp.]